MRYLSVLAVLLAFTFTACRKDEVFTDEPGTLVFSQDTVLFDTIFTEVASVTKRFTVRNTSDNAVRVDVTMESGGSSPFLLNVDGASGESFNDVEILGGDSVFVFVVATLGANNAGDPFIIEDRIQFNTNGNVQTVLINAWGQDAHYIRTEELIAGLPPIGYIAHENEAVHWVNDKPYVIYGCYGVVDEGGSLTIDPGVRVYFHGPGSGMWIYVNGSIQAVGTVTDPITFQQDRLEALYDDLPNQWDRIWINEGTAENRFENCVIKNALIGIQAQTFPLTTGQPLSTNTLVLQNVNIQNCFTACLYSENYRIKATNLLLSDAGQYSAVLTGGGQYTFNHFTIANDWSFEVRQSPTFLINNSFSSIEDGVVSRAIETSTFTNGIIHGSNTNEFQLLLDEAPGVAVTFDRCIIKTDQATDDSDIFPDQDRIYRNISPGFADPAVWNFHLTDVSQAKSKADPIVDFEAQKDLDDRDRPNFSDDAVPDLGCYEQYD